MVVKTLDKASTTALTETELSSETVFKGRLMHVKCDHVRLPNGKESTREYIVHPGAVVVIPVFDNRDLLLERQHRYPLHRDFIELPAGKIDPGEDDLTCAKRELEEETGYTAAKWREVTTIYPCIGYSDERLAFIWRKGSPKATTAATTTNSWKSSACRSPRRWAGS